MRNIFYSFNLGVPSDGEDLCYVQMNFPLTLVRKGDDGKSVKLIQFLLDILGYYVGSTGIDGYFGDDTEKAVEAFQENNDISVDGIVGPDTWNKLCDDGV